MAAAGDLQEIRDIYFYIGELSNDLKRLKESETSLISPAMCSAAAGNKQKSFDVLERQVIKYLSDFNQIALLTNDKIARLAIIRNKQIDSIMSMKEGQARRFLIDYYIDCKSLTEISNNYMFEDPQSIYNLHRRALQAYKKHIGSGQPKK